MTWELAPTGRAYPRPTGNAWPLSIAESNGGRRAQFGELLDRLLSARGPMGGLRWPAISRAEGAALAATAQRVALAEAPTSPAIPLLDDVLRAQLGWTGHIADPWRLRDAANNYCAAPAILWGAVGRAIADIPERPAPSLALEQPSLANLRRWASAQLAKIRRELGQKLPRPVLPTLPTNPFAGWGTVAVIVVGVFLLSER